MRQKGAYEDRTYNFDSYLTPNCADFIGWKSRAAVFVASESFRYSKSKLVAPIRWPKSRLWRGTNRVFETEAPSFFDNFISGALGILRCIYQCGSCWYWSHRAFCIIFSIPTLNMYRAVPSVSHTFANSVKASYLRSSRPLVFATFNSCRCLSTSTKSYNQSTLRSGKVDESAAKGVEGPHYADATTVVKHEHDLHTTGEIRGDWVLFHPVYSSNELKAIEVNPHIYVIL